MSNAELAIHFLIQLVAILVACRAVGWIARRLGQPQVIGEMIAGIALGPSLLGLIPNVQTLLFPKETMGVLYVVSQLGLALYMFIVGLTFEVSLVRHRLRLAAAVSGAGIFVPFVLSGGIAYFLANDATFFSQNITTLEAMLFLGAAMCITAFPVLARIIQERGLTNTPLGTLLLAAASIDDAVAWTLLAGVVALASNNGWLVVLTPGGGVLYATGMLSIGARLLRRLTPIVEQHGIHGTFLSLILAGVLLAASYAELIGIHAVFGAFLFGVALPRGIVVNELRRTLEPLVTTLLLPVFFSYSGLNTRLGVLQNPALWLILLVVIGAACVGKAVACSTVARLNGESVRESLAIGTLMNARGLTELIILNIGLDRAIITPTLFTIMVIMALTTTLLATPLFNRVYSQHPVQTMLSPS